MGHSHDPLRPHTHEPNPTPPSDDASIQLILPDGSEVRYGPTDLETLPATDVADCYIVSTGHGTSGPFRFTGVRLLDLVRHVLPEAAWSQLEVISADGFGNRVYAEELLAPNQSRPILLAYALDGQALRRAEGLVRLIVPSETDDALRQVKWVARIVIRP